LTESRGGDNYLHRTRVFSLLGKSSLAVAREWNRYSRALTLQWYKYIIITTILYRYSMVLCSEQRINYILLLLLSSYKHTSASRWNKIIYKMRPNPYVANILFVVAIYYYYHYHRCDLRQAAVVIRCSHL